MSCACWNATHGATVLTSLFFSQTIQTVTENGTIMHTTQQWLTTYNLFLNTSSENIQTIDNIWNQIYSARVEVLAAVLLNIQAVWECHELHNQWHSSTSLNTWAFKNLVSKINSTIFIMSLQFLKQRTTKQQHKYQMGRILICAILVIFTICSWAIGTMPCSLYLILQGTLRNYLMFMYFIVQGPYLISQLLYVISGSYCTVHMGWLGYVIKTNEPTGSGIQYLSNMILTLHNIKWIRKHATLKFLKNVLQD